MCVSDEVMTMMDEQKCKGSYFDKDICQREKAKGLH